MALNIKLRTNGPNGTKVIIEDVVSLGRTDDGALIVLTEQGKDYTFSDGTIIEADEESL